jgi:tetratricopeptide (TPR) repeat protein
MTDQTLLKDKIQEYRKALLQDPKSMVFVPLAACYLKSGMLDDALEIALRGTWELPDYPPGYVAVGRVYAQRDVHEKSIAAFQKAIDIDPSCLDAYKLMARMYREQGNIDAATNLLTNAVFIFPAEDSLKQMLESLAPVAVNAPPVVETVDPLPSEDTAKPITTATIAEIYIEQGLYSKALEVYRELYEKTKSPEVAKKIAEIEILDQGGAVQSTTAEVLPDVAPVSNPSVAIEPAPSTLQSGVAAPVSEQSVLDTLNGMLTSIQSRRNRV